MVSLKFPLQGPLQAVATTSSGNNHTTIISSKLNCFIKQAGLLIIQHLLENIPSKHNWVIKTVVNKSKQRGLQQQENVRGFQSKPDVGLKEGIGFVPIECEQVKDP